MVKPGPVGLLLNTRASKPWKIGKCLGIGACGSVHEIEREDEISCNYVVKVASIPAAASGTTKRKKKTAEERNADLLYHENTLYRNVLNDLRGNMIPDVPMPGKGPPGFGDIEGYRFLVMEKMNAHFSEVVTILLSDDQKRARQQSSSSSSRRSISLCHIATTLVSIIEAIHDCKHVVVDVKPENLMLTPYFPPKKSSASSSVDAEVAKRIRMIDFGLVETFGDVSVSSHRQDAFPNAQFVGTPVYASLNVLEGHTPSRRDDLEAVGYIVAEVILKILFRCGICGSMSKKASNVRNASGSKNSMDDEQHLLPWSRGKSDKEIFDVKKKAVSGGKSGIFFTAIAAGGNEGARDAMLEYFDLVQKIGYSEKPNYDELRLALDKLKIRITDNAGSGTSVIAGAKGPGKRLPAKRVLETKKTVEGATLVSNASLRGTRAAARTPSTTTAKAALKVSPGSKRRISSSEYSGERKCNGNGPPLSKVLKSTKVPVSKSPYVIEIEDRSDSSFRSCHSSSEEMEWEATPDEEFTSTSTKNGAAERMKKKQNGGIKLGSSLQLLVIDGPHCDESFYLDESGSNTFTIGQNPVGNSRSKAGDYFRINKDSIASPIHAKVTLTKTKGGLSVRVTDLNSVSGTMLNGKLIPSGGRRQAFIEDKIRIGESTLQVKKIT